MAKSRVRRADVAGITAEARGGRKTSLIGVAARKPVLIKTFQPFLSFIIQMVGRWCSASSSPPGLRSSLEFSLRCIIGSYFSRISRRPRRHDSAAAHFPPCGATEQACGSTDMRKPATARARSAAARSRLDLSGRASRFGPGFLRRDFGGVSGRNHAVKHQRAVTSSEAVHHHRHNVLRTGNIFHMPGKIDGRVGRNRRRFSYEQQLFLEEKSYAHSRRAPSALRR